MRGFNLFVVAAFFLTLQPAVAQKRVALVMGNASYGNVPKLSNPANDADAIGLLLKNVGFTTVDVRRDLNISGMRHAINDFVDLTKDADIAVVFFAGHGIEVDGSNYLVPTDARLARDLDVEDETISLDRVLRALEPAKRLRLVILDACRENPFAKSMKRTLPNRSVGRGLGRVEPATSDTLIAFAAKAGSTAADGDGIHSPFTTALLQHLPTPGLDVRLAFGQVRDDVLRITGKRQEPFVYGSLGGGLISLATLSSGEPEAKGAVDTQSVAARDYDAAARVGTKEAWDAFLAIHPTGFYGDLARSQRAKLETAKKKPAGNDKEEAVKSKVGKSEPSAGQKRATGGNQIACCLAYCQRIGCNAPALPRACQADLVAYANRHGVNYCRI